MWLLKITIKLQRVIKYKMSLNAAKDCSSMSSTGKGYHSLIVQKKGILIGCGMVWARIKRNLCLWPLVTEIITVYANKFIYSLEEVDDIRIASSIR